MINTLFIDDSYLYSKFPLPSRIDRSSLLPLIKLEQYTSIQDLLGTCLYEDIEAKVVAQTLSADEEKLFAMVQYSLALYSAKSAIAFLRSETARTKEEERNSTTYVLDSLQSSVQSKIEYIDTRIRKFIKSTAAIYAVATATGCDNDLFEENDNYQGSVFFPYDGLSSEDCDSISIV